MVDQNILIYSIGIYLIMVKAEESFVERKFLCEMQYCKIQQFDDLSIACWIACLLSHQFM